MAELDDFYALMEALNETFSGRFWDAAPGRYALLGCIMATIDDLGYGYEIATVFHPSSGDVSAESGPAATVYTFDSDGYVLESYFAVGRHPALALGLALLRSQGIASYDNGEELPF